MKDKRQKQKQKAKIIREKLIQKKEHIQSIRKDLEKKRKKLEKKMTTMMILFLLKRNKRMR